MGAGRSISSSLISSARRSSNAGRNDSVAKVDCNRIIIENLNKARPCTYSLSGVPSWLIVQDDDLSGELAAGISKVIFGRVIEEDFDDDISPAMCVMKVEVKGGLDKMIAAVDYKRQAAERAREDDIKKKQNSGKLHKVLGQFGDGNLKV